MLQGTTVIFIDSNVFLIDLRYPRDVNAPTNSRFLARARERGDAGTSVLNLLEVLGVLSFNLNEQQLANLYRLFADRYGIAVLPNAEPDCLLPRYPVGRLVERISRRLSLGDAMILEHAESKAFRVRTFVSWDAPHFLGRTSLEVVTPAEYLEHQE